MEVLLLLAAPLVVVATLWLLGRSARRKRTQAEWEKLPSGATYNPLQELIEPQSRHGVEVAQQRADADDQGASD
jgi:hypothetical protein